ncbi:nitrate/sulfonate/bicarbonate ABC transporter ATP-binding protein [Edaphobacter sp.]|uniref:ABC transporter ATP-binding protein n=1 Tax=Edaphobacter sp. TaxID=1934404 RepID=UPI002DC057CD|nr:nitrate/sulfonate/bicarbonate ABC transporter ATP-binding protein [Edaphobacter sp.]HEU5339966.1 nitrate/sulfonate/bicarbonate ABC transporter ATP-binding protein [Edaphobacter sp.]
MQSVIIRAERVEKYYAQPSENRIQVIAPTDLSIAAGEIVAVLGPSGSGKSTLLRMLTGLSQPSAGEVYWHEKPIATADVNVSIVFQSFALFPWLTVLENVEAPLKARGMEAAERRRRSLKILDAVGLDGFQAAYPKELSGGMRQRVGFARALVVEPEVLFMDEPFSALDVLTAENLRSELLELWQKKTIPTQAIFIVTHNIEEAVLLADRIIVLGRNPGRVRTDFKVTIPHPRDKKTAAFTQLVDYIYKVLTQPDTQPPALPEARTGKPGGAPKQHYQMLPHARPGGIAGLLELLLDHNGKDDIYRLADDLAFEIDDLLPIVDAAQLLGFLTVTEGDAAITPTGTEYANSEILRQKELFRSAAVENVLLLRQIIRAIEAKSDRSVPEEFFHDMLDEQFSEDETLRQLETAINWGRYAELFDFDASRRRFIQPEKLTAENDNQATEEIDA